MKMLIGGCSPHGTSKATTAYGFYFEKEENDGVSVGIMVDNGSGVNKVADFISEHKPDTIIQLQTHAHFDHLQGIHDNHILFSETDCVITSNSTLQAMSAVLQRPYWPVERHIHDKVIWNFENEAKILPGQCGSIVIQPKQLPHGEIASLGFKIYTPQFEIVVATDCELMHTAVRTRFIDWVEKTDLVLIDTQYTRDEYRDKCGWGHNSSAIVAEIVARHPIMDRYSSYFLVHGHEKSYKEVKEHDKFNMCHIPTEGKVYELKRR